MARSVRAQRSVDRVRAHPLTLIVNTAFQQYFIAPSFDGFRKLDNKENLPWSVYLGVAGMPGMSTHTLAISEQLTEYRYSGQTAYYAWKEYASPKKGETVFVSAGAGRSSAIVPRDVLLTARYSKDLWARW